MRHQKFIDAIRLAVFHLRKLGFLYFVPLIILYILIPFLSGGYISYYGIGENSFSRIFFDFQKMIPFMGTWWPIFGLADYADGNASELLRVYKKTVLPDFLLLLIWYVLHACILFMAYSIFLENYWMDFLLIAVEIFLFSALSFFLLFATRTVLVPFLTILLYEIFAFLSNTGPLQYVNIFSLSRITAWEQLITPYLYLFLLSIVFIFLGDRFYKSNRKSRRQTRF